MFTEKDLKSIADRGISLETVEQQLDFYKSGFPTLNVIAAATPNRGIKVLTENDKDTALKAQEQEQLKITKFTPASGAASRMFKDLFEVLSSGTMSPYAEKFVSRIKDFAFYDSTLLNGKDGFEVIDKVLNKKGLDYGEKPKGQLLFHRYPSEVRTAFEEHLVEGALYAKMADSSVNIVVSASPEHVKGFKALFESVRVKYEKRYDVHYNVVFTLQSPATDVIAVTDTNEPFRKEDGEILFRPGGHGALIENINEIDADILIIKNIDNVVKEDYIEQTVLCKKILTGVVIESRKKGFAYIRALDKALQQGDSQDINKLCGEISTFLSNEYCIELPELSKDKLPQYLRAKLNRPIRACGMVRNLGEPGGGPFIIRESDGSTSLQIVESAQLPTNDSHIAGLFASGTHFNPVDLICSITDYQGRKFDLRKYVDPKSGFISSKSYEGRPLKAQELPGLWNGAMSDWNTIFVEVPLITFNPVKTVMDLLRKEHLG